MNEILERLKALNLGIEHIFPVKGGDINDTYRIESYQEKYFLKLNTAQNFPQLFVKEAQGLETIAQTGLFKVPTVIKYGETDNNFQYLILEWLEKGVPNLDDWQKLGQQLALYHQHTNDQFGWDVDNYIAIILQPNQWKNTWEEFYTNNRILPMIKLLADKKLITTKEVKAAEVLCKELSTIFPTEKPALLHGDFWNGNLLPMADGDIALIDPAVYYGHREMDLAIADLFGGFDDAFFAAYNEINPLEPGFDERKSIAQLFPLLIHAFLFQGYYIKDVKAILKKYQYKLQ